MTVNIHQAKTNLSKLINIVEDSEDVIIARAGKPVAKLVAYTPQKTRKAGLLKNKIKYLEDFKESDKEVEELFYGE